MLYKFSSMDYSSVVCCGGKAFFYGTGGIFKNTAQDTLTQVLSYAIANVWVSGTRLLAKTDGGAYYVSDDLGATWKTSNANFGTLAANYQVFGRKDGSFVAVCTGGRNLGFDAAKTVYGTVDGITWYSANVANYNSSSITFSVDTAADGNTYFVVSGMHDDGGLYLFQTYVVDLSSGTSLKLTRIGTSTQSVGTSVYLKGYPLLYKTDERLILFMVYDHTANTDNDFEQRIYIFYQTAIDGTYGSLTQLSGTFSAESYFHPIGRAGGNRVWIRLDGVLYGFHKDSENRLAYDTIGLITDLGVSSQGKDDDEGWGQDWVDIRDIDDTHSIVCRHSTTISTTGYLYLITSGNGGNTVKRLSSSKTPMMFLGSPTNGATFGVLTLSTAYPRQFTSVSPTTLASNSAGHYGVLAIDAWGSVVLYIVSIDGSGVFIEKTVSGGNSLGEECFTEGTYSFPEDGRRICLGEDGASYYYTSSDGRGGYYQVFPSCENTGLELHAAREKENYLTATLTASNAEKIQRQGLVFTIGDSEIEFGTPHEIAATFNSDGYTTSEFNIAAKTTEGVSCTANYSTRQKPYTDKKFGTHAFGLFGSSAPTFTFKTLFPLSAYNSNYVKCEFALDGVLKKTAWGAGGEYSLTFTASEWNSVSNGDHVLTLTLSETDSRGALTGATSTETFTFSKGSTNLAFITQTFDGAQGTRPVRIAVAIKANLVAGNASVFACNNAYDASPTWEDITEYVRATGSPFAFQNTTKTASKWGVAIKIQASNPAADGSVWISSISGGFEEEETA